MLDKGYYMGMAVPVEDGGLTYGYQLGSTKNGAEYARVVLQVVEGPFKGETIEWDGWLTTQKAIDKTMEGLRLLGYDAHKGNIVDGQTQKLTRRVSFTVEHEEYKGQVKAKVAWINDPADRFKVSKDSRIQGAAADRLLARINGTPAATTPSFDDDDDSSQLNF